MERNTDIWETIATVQETYEALRLSDMKDYDKFYLYALITHSTAIEGSTLTEKEVQLLFDEGLTKKGNMVEHFMNIDLKAAYEFAAIEAKKKSKLSPVFLKQMNALIMKNTGSSYNVPVGTFDSSKGEYRLLDVTAGVGGRSYMDYKKVPDKVNGLCHIINEKLDSVITLKEKYNLCFDAHFNLVTIHPWVDGNGRTSRLLMNYLQFYHQIVPTKIHKQDKGEYISALEESREKENNEPIRYFMAKQHLKTLREEIDNYKKGKKKSDSFGFLF